jgi:hypothetical protein
MSKIITFLTNDNKIIQQADNLQPPPNSFAILSDNYDILDMTGDPIQLRDNNKINFCRKALEDIHIDNIKNITSEMTKYKKLISDLELLSQKSSNEEYDKYSEDANRYIEQLEELNNEIERLTTLYETKTRSRSPPRSYRSNSPPRSPRVRIQQRMAQNACTSSALIDNTGYTVTDVNGWDKNAVETVRNWRILFKENKYIYEWVLEKNYKIWENFSLYFFTFNVRI